MELTYVRVVLHDASDIYHLLTDEVEGEPLRWREAYRTLCCGNCGKIDEERALRSYLSPDFRINRKADARRDLLRTWDEVLLVGQRLVELIRREGVSGVELLPLPGDNRFMVMLPERVPADFSRSGLTVVANHATGGWDGGHFLRGRDVRPPGAKTEDGRCIGCRRHFQTLGFIRPDCLTAPVGGLRFFTTSFNHESIRSNRFYLLCTERLADLLLAEKVTGVALKHAGTAKRWTLGTGRMRPFSG